MTVSVVMPVYNAERYLKLSITSILNQTFKDFEFIVVNDGSIDHSFSILEAYPDPRIRIINQENRGVAEALNAGIDRAVGKYIIRADADDINHPLRIEKQIEFLERNPEYILVASFARVIDETGRFVYRSGNISEWQDILETFPFPPFFHSSVAFLKETVKSVGSYDVTVSRLNAFEDLILWNRIKNLGKMHIIPEYLIDYRLTPDASTPKIGEIAKITRKNVLIFLEKGTIPEENKKVFLEAKASMTIKNRQYNYHKYLLKKYALENPEREMVLLHFRKAIRLKPFDYKLWVFLFLAILPKTLSNRLKNWTKSKSDFA